MCLLVYNDFFKKCFMLSSTAPEIFESSGFMDALGSTEIIPGRRKRKLSQNNLPSQKPSSSSASAAGAPSAAAASVSPSSTEEKKAVVPSVSFVLVLVSMLCY